MTREDARVAAALASSVAALTEAYVALYRVQPGDYDLTRAVRRAVLSAERKLVAFEEATR